ncbi:MAG TPA: 30S ribosomal protein S1 [Acidimicrobiia bacterium]|nr:30S ribosomal protein S1 [Acidimicrobiia bacterium]
MSDQEPGAIAESIAPDETAPAPAAEVESAPAESVPEESATPESAPTESAPAESKPAADETQPDPSEDTVVVLDDLDGSLEDAINATIVEFDDGSLVKGTVVKIDSDEVLLDIGFKSEGVIPTKELSIRNDVDPHEVVSLGEEVEALVLQKEDKDGRLILSKKRAQYEKAWGTIEAKKEADEVVSGPVIEVVKGGLIIDIGLRGFLPASLVDLRRVRDLHPFVGKVLDCKIIELDKNRNNVVLSRRAYLEETQREQRDEFLTNLQPGEIRKGTVSSVVNFGAFVDLGGMDGLVHVSELSWKHVDHPSSVVQVGDEVTVQVLDVDLSRERISLSLKATQQDPWQEFAGGHQVGELVYGRVTKLVPFGAFVQVGEGIEGLVHISEMAEEHVEAPEQVVTPGEELWVKIIDIDLDRRRISLSIKQAAEGGEVAAEYREFYGEHAYDEQGNYIGPEFEAPPEGEAPADAAPEPDGGSPDAAAEAAPATEAEAEAETPAAE